MLAADDVFVIDKNNAFQGLFSPLKTNPTQTQVPDLPTSPMSTNETYLALKDKYQMSLLRMKDKKRNEGTKAKTLMRRQSRVSISAMLENVTSIAATPLKFLSDSDNILTTVKKSTMKRNSLYLKKTTSPKRHKYHNKKHIKDIFAEQFKVNTLYNRGITEPTPPSSLAKKNGVKLHPVSDTDLWLRLFPTPEDFTTVAEVVVSVTEEEPVSIPIVEEQQQVEPVVVSPPKAVVSVSVETRSSQYDAMYTAAEERVNNFKAQAKRRASTMNYTGKTKYNSDLMEHNPMKTAQNDVKLTPTKTNSAAVSEVIQFSARKMAALVKSMKKHDQNVRNSLVSAPVVAVETAVEPCEVHENVVNESLAADASSASMSPLIEIKDYKNNRKSILTRKQSLPLAPLGELHQNNQNSTIFDEPITLAPKLNRTPVNNNRRVSLQAGKSPEYYFMMDVNSPTQEQLSPPPINKSVVTFATPAQSTKSTPVTPLSGASTVPATPVARLSTPAPFKTANKNKVTCSLDSAMKFNIPDSICAPRQSLGSENDENMSEDQLNQSYFTDVPSPVPAESTPKKILSLSNAATPLKISPMQSTTPIKTPYSAFKNREGAATSGKKKYENKLRELFQSCDNVLSQISDFF